VKLRSDDRSAPRRTGRSGWHGIPLGKSDSGCWADLRAGHFRVDEEPERVLQLVAFHQPVQRLLPQLRQSGGAGVACQARGGDLQGQRVITLCQQRLGRVGERFWLAAG
jgi:hypothetical protein